MLILVYSADVTQSPTYESTVEAVCGPVVKFFAELCLVAFCFGSNTAYLVVIGDQVQDSEFNIYSGVTKVYFLLSACVVMGPYVKAQKKKKILILQQIYTETSGLSMSCTVLQLA